MAQTITINASVNSQCNLNSPTVALGALTLISGTITNTGTNLVLTCNKGATVSVALSDGGNLPAGSKAHEQRQRRIHQLQHFASDAAARSRWQYVPGIARN